MTHVLTGLDLPWGSPGGSVELLKDLYLAEDGPLDADAFMLVPDASLSGTSTRLPTLLDVPGKQLDGTGFWTYVERLTNEVTTRFASTAPDVVHLQHLAFGATPALLRGYPNKPHIALVHGTDLLFAARHPTQAEVLQETVRTARSLVVPTTAMLDRLREFTPVDTRRVVHIPWGVPDQLLAKPPQRATEDPGGQLRLLYAGRLTAEKGASELTGLLGGVRGVRLSVAAPRHEYAALAKAKDLSTIRYLGWLTRQQLWDTFADHDLLVIPSAELEAFGLVAVEAQACGLPVAYQPVPGLTETLGDSGLALDLLNDPRGATASLAALCEDRSALEELRRAGHRNAARFPLSATAHALQALSEGVA